MMVMAKCQEFIHKCQEFIHKSIYNFVTFNNFRADYRLKCFQNLTAANPLLYLVKIFILIFKKELLGILKIQQFYYLRNQGN